MIANTHLASNVVLDEEVLALVVEDDVYLLGAWSTDVRPEHDVVVGLSVHVLLVHRTREYLHGKEATKVKRVELIKAKTQDIKYNVWHALESESKSCFIYTIYYYTARLSVQIIEQLCTHMQVQYRCS